MCGASIGWIAIQNTPFDCVEVQTATYESALHAAQSTETGVYDMTRDEAQLPKDIFLRPRDVAARTGYSVSTLARWRCHGEGPVFRKVNRACVYRWGDVLEWLGAPRHSTSDRTSRPTRAA